MSSLKQLLSNVRKRTKDSKRRNDFAATVKTRLYRPASLEAVAAVESSLQFALPPLLARLYTEVGNGGFGPGYGILGLPGGHRDDEGRSIVEAYRFMQSLFKQEWPDGLLPLCEWGSFIWSCVACINDDYSIYTLHDEGTTKTTFSLESWLYAWSEGAHLWDQMFEFETVRRPNPFTGQMVPVKVPRKPRGA